MYQARFPSLNHDRRRAQQAKARLIAGDHAPRPHASAFIREHPLAITAAAAALAAGLLLTRSSRLRSVARRAASIGAGIAIRKAVRALSKH